MLQLLKYSLLLFGLFGFSSYSSAQSYIDSNAQYYFTVFQANEYVDTAAAWNALDSGYYWAKRSNNPELIAFAHQFYGWYYQDRAKFKKANSEFYKSLSYFKKANNRQGVANAYGNIGNSYFDMEEYQKSLDNQLLSLTENEKILAGNPEDADVLMNASYGRTYALHNIADLYSEIELFDKAFEFEFKSLKFELTSGTSAGVGISYVTLGVLHKKLNDVDSARYYFQAAIDTFQVEMDPYSYATALQEYASLENSGLTRLKEDDMIEEALSIRLDLGDLKGEAEVLMEICEMRSDELKIDSLSQLLERIYSLIQLEGLEGMQERYFRIYSKYNSRLGKFDRAYFALENYLELKAVSDEKRRTHDLIVGGLRQQLKMQFYNDSLRQQSDFALERAQHQEDISKIQNIVYLSVIGFIALIATLAFFVNKNRRRKRMNDLLSEKNTAINIQKSIVEEKNQSISDSINYARRLQAAILPTPEQINTHLPNSFLIFRPKDVVSGDFYWFEKSDNIRLLAVADCTGHGVPGAMVSVVCSNALNRAVNEFGLIAPNEILDKTREIVIDTFARSGENVADGMDISLIAIDETTNRLIFSGAHNGLWLVRKNKELSSTDYVSARKIVGDTRTLIEFKGDKQPIGLYENLSPFNKQEIELKEGDIFYLFSDGYADQFGGEHGKKFKYAPFKREILSVSDRSMNEQRAHLESVFDQWKGNHDQIDDVCVIGVVI